MESQNGATYPQNYDVIVKWLAEALQGETLVATLILSNKFIAKDRLYELWEEIKMLDILEVAREKGIEEGKTLGIEEGRSNAKACKNSKPSYGK